MTTNVKILATPTGIRNASLNRVAAFADKFVVTDSGCWTWTGSLDKGYGKFRIEGRVKRAHRVAWELMVPDPIDPKLTLDHLCGNKACVNPRHLEQVSIGTNLSRAAHAPA